ncbi:MAG TPA: DUF2330 domain-containing protein [Myxococcales bacterium]|jgi:hypothetical protein
MPTSTSSRRLAALCLLTAVGLLALPGLGRADGGIVAYSSGEDLWAPHPEQAQFAQISLRDGREEMVLAIEVAKLSSRAAWIFPVPGEPAQVQADIAADFPNVVGLPLKWRMGDAFRLMPVAAMATQLYPLPFLLREVLSPRASALGGVGGEVVVAQHLEKHGLTLEVLTASDGAAFERYLLEKGLALPREMRDALAPYLGKHFTLLVAWLSPEQVAGEAGVAAQQRTQARGVKVSFPAKRPWFPLRLTSMYGQRVVPATLYVCGTVEPVVYQQLEGHVVSEWLWTEWPMACGDHFYTRVEITAPAYAFVEDLELEPRRALVARTKDWLATEKYQESVVVLALLLSVLSSVIAAALIHRGQRARLGRFAVLGLANLLTLAGFAVAAALARRPLAPVQAVGGTSLRSRAPMIVWAVLAALPMALASLSYLHGSDLDFALAGLWLGLEVALVVGIVVWDRRATVRRAPVFVATFSATFLALGSWLLVWAR